MARLLGFFCGADSAQQALQLRQLFPAKTDSLKDFGGGR